MEDGTFVGDTRPSYEARIQAIFDRIVAASSVNPPPNLEFTEAHSSDAFQVQVKRGLGDWHGIASLWAMSQSVGRLYAAMFNARRSGSAIRPSRSCFSIRCPTASNPRWRTRLMSESTRLYVDETTAAVLDPGRGKTKTGYLWAVLRDDRGWNGSAPPGVVFHYRPGRVTANMPQKSSMASMARFKWMPMVATLTSPRPNARVASR
ncbi:putative transposase (plasmid) [Rhizobium sp. CCGE 510]|nr:putative transposase [Rhizobium sp. CCGE 510]